MVNPFQGIAQGVKKLGEHFASVLDHLNPKRETFILTETLDSLSNIISYLNPFHENFFGNKLVEFIGDLLKKLFIPQEDHFTELHNEINTKLGFVGQIKDLYYSLFPENSPNSVTSPPNWTITYEGITVEIIDWSAFEEYRGYLHSIIIFIMWASFLIRLYKRVPMLIYGYYDG